MPVSADVCVDIFKDQASVTALEDTLTVMEKMHAIIESENARNASNDKQHFTASMTAELRKLQAEAASLKSGGGTGEAGCVSQAYIANANKRSYTLEAGSQKNGRIEPPTFPHRHLLLQCPWLMPPDFPRRDCVLQRRKEAGVDKKEGSWETTDGQAEKGFPSAMLASTTHQSDNLTNQPTPAAVASVVPVETGRICPGLEPSLEDDAVRNSYQAGGLIKPRTLASTPKPEHFWPVLSILSNMVLATGFLLLGVVITFATTLPAPTPELLLAAYVHVSTTTPTAPFNVSEPDPHAPPAQKTTNRNYQH
eukprot:6210866-Pleurochrysis_carterae.AAC.1